MKNKCEDTGKTRFDSLAEAKDIMLRFRGMWKLHREGKRRKHRQGKPAQKRAYYCGYCGGYHLTSKSLFGNNRNPYSHDYYMKTIKKLLKDACQPQAG
ncbi:hypothetical protein BDD43_4649 [Mucilaginibacter gracilis]|uniref:Uncharacterized protein n=1 Tax=Mucilaginibacter gracilis TaxID=423350 RepID=A0A495J7S5_9SPHI|nr:hypothetical protein [Mucilaginibacter gracilis]RKR84414.1 hypothetical protein BDD43_4649 [Mucilaginibacter gracilis]